MKPNTPEKSGRVNPAAIAAAYARLCEAEHDAALFGAGSSEYLQAYEARKRGAIRLHIARGNLRRYGNDCLPSLERGWIDDEYMAYDACQRRRQ